MLPWDIPPSSLHVGPNLSRPTYTSSRAQSAHQDPKTSPSMGHPLRPVALADPLSVSRRFIHVRAYAKNKLEL